MIAVVARLFVMIVVVFLLAAVVIGAIAFFKTRKLIGMMSSQQSAHRPPHGQDASQVIEGEYKVISDDQKTGT